MKRLESKIIEVNQRYETRFDSANSPNFSAGGDSTYFDPGNRKILFLKLDCRIWWLFDFDMIGAWRLCLEDRPIAIAAERLGGSRQGVHIEFSFKKTTMSSISMAIADRHQGDLWNHRISLMLK
ncbi:hypothetical protein PQR62_23060 [Herbaspirillum lusitanum]|uniref:Uncharacterized protein n=1 Tax=Herbaspirillum lusitanum TaxID=213312 RepID=A0ABW9AF22_9BURK